MLRRHATLALFATLVSPLACDTGSSEPEVPDNEFCADVADWDEDASAFERELLERANLHRQVGATCGAVEFEPAEPLVMSDALRCAARVHALDMATRDYVMHTTPEGQTFGERASMAGFDGMPLAQNLATGLVEPKDVIETWMGIESSCTNLMNPSATALGVGYVESDDASFGTYWVALLGQ